MTSELKIKPFSLIETTEMIYLCTDGKAEPYYCTSMECRDLDDSHDRLEAHEANGFATHRDGFVCGKKLWHYQPELQDAQNIVIHASLEDCFPKSVVIHLTEYDEEDEDGISLDELFEDVVIVDDGEANHTNLTCDFGEFLYRIGLSDKSHGAPVHNGKIVYAWAEEV